MKRRQTNPRHWFIVQHGAEPRVLRRLVPGTGVLLIDRREDEL